MHQVVLGLGTNIGRRWQHLEQAVAKLSEIVTVTAVSPVYESEPWGPIAQPAFLNVCLVGQTELSPQMLLASLKILEKDMGRTITEKWGPRLIDIDILLYADVVLQTEHLTIPHPYMQERAFVLIPLADIAPDVVHPVLGQTIVELATAVDHSTLRRQSEPLSIFEAITD